MRPNVTHFHRLSLGVGVGAIGVLLLLDASLIAAIAVKAIQPSTVVVRCAATGAVTLPPLVSLPDQTNEQAVRFFLERFFDLYLEQERTGTPNDTLALMVTPAFSRAVTTSWQPPQWEDKSLLPHFTVERLSFSGDWATGGRLQVMGTGTLLFLPAPRIEAADAQEGAVSVFFQATLLVEPMTAKTPYGLLVHWINPLFFENDTLRDTFLEKAHLHD